MPNYAKLHGKIVECGANQKQIALAIGISSKAMYDKMAGKFDWQRWEIHAMTKVLGLTAEDIVRLFFSKEQEG